MPIPTNRTTSNTAAEHVADHNLIHALYNLFEGKSPSDFATTVHTHTTTSIVSGVFAPARLGSGTADGTTALFGDSTYKKTLSADQLRLSVPGNLTTGTGATRVPIYQAQTMKRVTLVVPVGEGPAGGDIMVDLILWLSPFTSGTSLWASNPSNRPKILAGATIGTKTTFDTSAIPDGALISADIVTVGALPTPGSNLIIAAAMEAA